MNSPGSGVTALTAEQFCDALIRVAIVAMLVIAERRVFSPSKYLMLWALILAVTIYPGHQTLAATLGCSQLGAATLSVLLLTIIQWVAMQAEEDSVGQARAVEGSR